MPVIEVRHPLVRHKVGLLRENDISTKQFRELTNELGRLLAYEATVDLLKSRGCTDVRALVLVAAPEGIRALDAKHPDVRCWTAAIDSHLNEVGYIIPGLGDAGDKIFGTKDLS